MCSNTTCKKIDKRTNTERYTISKKQYVRDKLHLSELQDKYHERLTSNGFDLERGIKGNDAKHQKVREFKKTTRYYENKVDTINKSIGNAMNEFEEKLKTNKSIPFDKKHFIVEKETFESMNNVIKETKKAIEFQPKVDNLFNEVQSFTKSHQTLEKENKSMEKEINKLKSRNKELINENDGLRLFINNILNTIKEFFRKLLKIGNEEVKDEVAIEVKYHYDNKNFDSNDIYDIAKKTNREDELFDYANLLYYYKSRNKNKEKDDFELSM